MFEAGFFGTKAPMFMDIVTLIVVLLPLLVYGSIFLAIKRQLRWHKITQVALFFVTISVVLFFEYGVRVDGGIKKYITYTDLSDSFVMGFLIIHIAIATGMMAIWGRLIYLSFKAEKAGELPGKFSETHRRLTWVTNISIVLTSLTGFGVYYILFMS